MADFNLELATLRMVRTRERYERFANMIPGGTINKETLALLKRMGEFFKGTEAEELKYDEFWPFLRSRYPNWKDKDIEFWGAAVKPLDKGNPAGLDEQIIENLLTKSLGLKLVSAIEKWEGGEEIDLGAFVRAEIETFEDTLVRKIRTPDVVLGWDEMIEEDEHNVGLHWRLPCLTAHVRALRPGDFGIIAMRPGRGKSTMVSSEVTFMAQQVKLLYPDRFRPVLWLNNEGPGRRIMARIRQSALGMSSSEIAKFGAAAARQKYLDLYEGHEDRIQVLDIHGMTNWEVEELVRKKDPALVVFDMIDNIRFSGDTANRGERNDQVLEAMYQWARELCVRYELAGIATSQIDNAGEGLRFPLLGMLKDSKTGKQGACDFIITGGYDPSLPNTRFIGLTKTKLNINGMAQSPDAGVFIDVDRGRLRMPEVD